MKYCRLTVKGKPSIFIMWYRSILNKVDLTLYQCCLCRFFTRWFQLNLIVQEKHAMIQWQYVPVTFFIIPKTWHYLLSTWVKEAKRAIIPMKVSEEYFHVFLF